MALFGKSGKKVRSAGAGTTVIASGCLIQGTLNGLQGPLYIEGQVHGTILSEAEVVVGPNGYVHGEVRASHMVVNGRVEGRIVCEDIDIMSSGVAKGELYCENMAIESGGRFIGQSFVGEVPDDDPYQVNVVDHVPEPLEGPREGEEALPEQLLPEEESSAKRA